MIGGRRYAASDTPRGALVAGAATPIQIRLPRPALRALKKFGSGRVRVTVTAIDAAGQETRRTIAVRSAAERAAMAGSSPR